MKDNWTAEAVSKRNNWKLNYEKSKTLADFIPLVKKYFPEEEWDNAIKVAYYESLLDPNAINDKGNSNGIDRGIFQINDYYHADTYGKYSNDWNNLETQVKAASEVWQKEKKNRNNAWEAWVAYKKHKDKFDNNMQEGNRYGETNTSLGAIAKQRSKETTTQTQEFPSFKDWTNDQDNMMGITYLNSFTDKIYNIEEAERLAERERKIGRIMGITEMLKSVADAFYVSGGAQVQPRQPVNTLRSIEKYSEQLQRLDQKKQMREAEMLNNSIRSLQVYEKLKSEHKADLRYKKEFEAQQDYRDRSLDLQEQQAKDNAYLRELETESRDRQRRREIEIREEEAALKKLRFEEEQKQNAWEKGQAIAKEAEKHKDVKTRVMFNSKSVDISTGVYWDIITKATKDGVIQNPLLLMDAQTGEIDETKGTTIVQQNFDKYYKVAPTYYEDGKKVQNKVVRKLSEAERQKYEKELSQIPGIYKAQRDNITAGNNIFVDGKLTSIPKDEIPQKLNELHEEFYQAIYNASVMLDLDFTPEQINKYLK